MLFPPGVHPLRCVRTGDPPTFRSGTVIALDWGLHMLEQTKAVNVVGIVDKLRHFRGGMVQHANQAAFIHDCTLAFGLIPTDARGRVAKWLLVALEGWDEVGWEAAAFTTVPLT